MGADLAESGSVPAAEYLREGRWRLAAGLARTAAALASSTVAAALATVERWLAVDQGCGAQAIHAEVQAWDTTDLPPAFGLAKLI